MSNLPSILVVGLTLGCFAALPALGFSVVYGVLGEANLAYGDAVVLATLFAAGVQQQAGSIPLTIAAGLLGSALLLLITDAVIRPLRAGGDALLPLMGTLGVALILRDIAGQTQGVEDRGFPGVAGGGSWRIAGTSVDSSLLAAAVTLVVIATAGAVLLRRSDWGRAVRAVRLDPLGARLCGIPVGRLVAVLYGVAGLVGGVAGLLRASHLGDVSVPDGFRITLIAFAAAAFGGGRSIPWAVGGGLILGMVASVVQFAYGEVWTQAAYLAVLVAVLLIRPHGLGAGAAGERV